MHPGHVCVLGSGGWESQGGKAAWDIMGLAGSSSHVSLSSREKTDNQEENRGPSRAWADPALAAVLVLWLPMLGPHDVPGAWGWQ